MEPVSSPRNGRVQAAVRLQRVRGRRDAGQSLIEGPHVLAEAVAAGASVAEVFGLADDVEGRRLADEAGARWTPVTERVMDKLASTETPRGPVSVVDVGADAAVTGDSVWIDVSDPGNAGTIIRTAAAFGLSVVVADDAVDPWSPKVLRAAAGGHFRTAVAVGAPPEAQLLATVATGGTPLDRLGAELTEGPVCILVGNEAHGLGRALIDLADVRVSIPMPGAIESLNAGVAAAIVMAELARLRGWNIGSEARPGPN